jgi:hypothetical protein
MSKAEHYDAIGNYREATGRITIHEATFKCHVCGGFCAILGRKALPGVGRNRKYACKACKGKV